MEALASGTPVSAFRSGALPEVVEHGRTGFIVDGKEEMTEAVK
jgi:glycosyltransferase involved in cell wall biosynthesis